MSDEAMMAALGTKEYKPAVGLQLVDALREKAKELSQAEGGL
jgi:hypothetical protein